MRFDHIEIPNGAILTSNNAELVAQIINELQIRCMGIPIFFEKISQKFVFFKHGIYLYKSQFEQDTMNKPLQFTQPTLREQVVNALDYIGVDIDDFNLKEEYFNAPQSDKHGYKHIYRVMIATALIAYRTQTSPRDGLLAFCAAFIHDLARRSDSEGSSHAINAARTKFAEHTALWDKYALTSDERSIVQAAVWEHACSHPHTYITRRIVTMLLKDADSLDRCRFHTRGRYDWKYTHHPFLKGPSHESPSPILHALIGETEALCGYTKAVRYSHIPSLRVFLSNVR